jgi:hypothetical protein
VAEVRYAPAVIRAECLLPAAGDHHHDSRDAEPAEACQPVDCPEWLQATIELPAGYDPSSIDIASLRLLGSVAADPGYSRIVDTDHDGLAELRVRFAFDAVAPHLSVGVNLATIVGRAASSEVRGTGTIEVLSLSTDMRVTPRTLERRSSGEDVQARIVFADGVSASDVSIDSVRLNGQVPVDRVVLAKKRDLVVKFGRAAVIGVLPLGDEVEVRVTGTLGGMPFVGVDTIRVIE